LISFLLHSSIGVLSKISQDSANKFGGIGSGTGGASILLKAPVATAKMISVFKRQYRPRFPKETASLKPVEMANEKIKLTAIATQGNFKPLKLQISGRAKLVVNAPAIPGVREESGPINSLKSGKLGMVYSFFRPEQASRVNG